MIELRDGQLVFRAPEVHPEASFSVDFQRTLRVPDDENGYPLPAGLGPISMEHVDDHAARVPPDWSRRGGVMLPMHAAEALWINLDARGYPWAVKVAAGLINAVSGSAWSTGLTAGEDDQLQDYLIVPDQPWLDGFNSGDGVIRQFVAMPLGAGYSVEEQVTGSATFGGIQLLAYPMSADAYERLGGFPHTRWMADAMGPMPMAVMAAPPDMGLGAGGRIHQSIEEDPYGVDVWDMEHPARCFVHLARAEQWQALTGRHAPTEPPTAQQYRAAGIPWFDYTRRGPEVRPSQTLQDVKSVATVAAGDGLELVDNDTVPVDRVIRIAKDREGVVTEWGAT